MSSFSVACVFVLPWRSLMWVFWIFCLCSSQLLKAFLPGAWKKKQATGNTRDMMAQRKTIPCCLPPASESLMYLPVPLALGHHPPPSCSSPTSPPPASHCLLIVYLKIAKLFLRLVSSLLIFAMNAAGIASIYIAKMHFLPHDSSSSVSTSELLAPPSVFWSHQPSVPQPSPKSSSLAACEGLSWPPKHPWTIPRAGTAQDLLACQ